MSIQEKAEALRESVKVGQEFTVAGVVMKCTKVEESGALMGVADFYTWHQLASFIVIGSIKQTTHENPHDRNPHN